MTRPDPWFLLRPVEPRSFDQLQADWYAECGRRGIEPRVTADDVERWQRERLAA